MILKYDRHFGEMYDFRKGLWAFCFLVVPLGCWLAGNVRLNESTMLYICKIKCYNAPARRRRRFLLLLSFFLSLSFVVVLFPPLSVPRKNTWGKIFKIRR